MEDYGDNLKSKEMFTNKRKMTERKQEIEKKQNEIDDDDDDDIKKDVGEKGDNKLSEKEQASVNRIMQNLRENEPTDRIHV